MLLGVLEHVDQGVSHLPRAAQDPIVVAISEHLASSAPEPVQTSGDPNHETLDSPRQGPSVLGLDQQVKVIALNGVMDQAEAASITAGREGPIQGLPCCVAAKRRQRIRESRGDENGLMRGEPGAPGV